MSKIYSSIFLLKDLTSISSLKTIFNNGGYRELLYHTKKDEKKVQDMSDEEKYFIYSWQEIGNVEEFKFENYQSSEESEQTGLEEIAIRFLKATANIEYSKKKRKDGQGNFLPKLERLNDTDVEMIFFERNHAVYVLILTSNEYNINRSTRLIGLKNIEPINEDYSLEVDIFNWLFWMYTDKEGTISEDLTLENISGFVGSVTDDANIFTGTSYQTTELIVTKAFISNGGNLKRITVRLRDKEADVTFMVNDKSTVILFCSNSTKLRILDNMDKAVFLLLYVYSCLIPKLKYLYQIEAEEFVLEESPKFSKKIGIEVIESIVRENDIKLNDLHFLEVKQQGVS